MARSTGHGRNLAITALVTSLIFLLAGWGYPLPPPSQSRPAHAPLQQASISWDTPNGTLNVLPGEVNRTFDATIRNTGTQSETLTMTFDNSDFPPGWTAEASPSDPGLTLLPGWDQTYKVFISAPANAAPGEIHIFQIQARTTSGATRTFYLTVNVVDPTPTNTPVPAPASVELRVPDDSLEGLPGATVKYKVTIHNPGPGKGRFLIDQDHRSCGLDISGCYETTNLSAVELDAGTSREFEVSVNLPSGAEKDQVGKTTIRVELEGNPDVVAELVLSTTVLEATSTPTRTPTRTPTPTPLSRICRDIYEDDDEQDQAVVIDVNVPQPNPNRHTDDNTDDRRAICPPGDEDWIKFGGVGGKVYTIDIDQMADGIDLSLEVYDERGRSIAFNDDYFKREAEKDWIMPRIDSWQAPTDGIYFVRIRDAAGRGGIDRTYRIRVLTESYGPTPVNVVEECLDIFEPDGLPEQASLIISNERQGNRKLCPTGDADWITFFGKKGKRYFIYTDTEPYGDKEVNQAQTGADTILVLTDRDGVSMIDYNDDIPGGETFDSQVEFTPEVDGFYYVQIKNVGDIGNQFIRYDLVLELCKPGQTDCGRVSNPASDTNGNADTSSSPSRSPTVPREAFSLDATSTPPPAPVGASESGNPASPPPPDFANAAFWKIWQRSDQSVASQRVARSWIWGTALASRNEPFAQTSGGRRQVQYFDKGRMEITNPLAEPTNQWFVTFGLLAQEMTSSQIQVGNSDFLSHPPANIPIVGDSNDWSAPTYASFRGVIGEPYPDLTGEYPLDTLDRAGNIGIYEGPRYVDSRLASYVAETGHNIPMIFWQFFNRQGEIYTQNQYQVGPLMEWLPIVGYPISEPYWIRAHINQVQRDALVQIYQRRVLAYLPANPPGEQVQMSNIGQHYYEWRYGQPPPRP